MEGSAGPSQMDAENWWRILVSKSFGNKSIDLAKAVAKMCKIMCSETCNYDNNRDVEAFVACTLVSLDKNSGVKPIGIGEVLRRVVGKVVNERIET